MPIGHSNAIWQCSDTTWWQTFASSAIWWPIFKLMQVAPSGGQICSSCKRRHLLANFKTNASGAIWWPFLQLMQVAPSGGEFCNKCKWRHLVVKTKAISTIWRQNLGLMQVEPPLAGEITQVKESIPWVRCASGNFYMSIFIVY